jgi:hypothetical protein
MALLEESPGSIGDVFDVALGAMDARMNPQVVSETSGGRLLMVARLRGSVLAVLWAWALLVVAGVGFQKMSEYDDFVRAARENAVVGGAFDAVVGGPSWRWRQSSSAGRPSASRRHAGPWPRAGGTCRCS